MSCCAGAHARVRAPVPTRHSPFPQALFECGKNKRVYTYGEYKRAMRGVLDRAHLPPADMEDIDYVCAGCAMCVCLRAPGSVAVMDVLLPADV